MSELLKRLRTATGERHQALHANSLLLNLHAESLDMSTYRKILQCFQSFYLEYEPRFSAQSGAFVEEFRPLPLLQQDIALTGGNLSQIPLEHPHGTEPDFSDYIGYLYVKQGSTLGGQQISRHVERSLGLRPGQEQFFFHGEGRATGPNWKSFQAFLVGDESRIVPETAVGSAITAFDFLREILNRNHQL